MDVDEQTAHTVQIVFCEQGLDFFWVREVCLFVHGGVGVIDDNEGVMLIHYHTLFNFSNELHELT